jgi:hypothetical protein
MAMADGRGQRNTWGEYLKSIQDRPDWSIARLAREANMDRGNIFDWIKGSISAERVTIGSVLLIAEAVGDDPLVTLRAAAGLMGTATEDDETIAEILASGLPQETQEELIQSVIDRRAQLRADTQRMIRLAGGQVA